MTGARRRFGAVVAAGALIGGTGLAAAVPTVLMAPVASAHSVLLSIDPQDGAEVTASPEQIVLTFNEEINQNFVTIAVTSGGDPTNRVTGDPTVDGATVTAQVGDLPAGDYTIGYRVTSADGHVVSGSSTFRVAGGAGDGDAEGGAEATGAEAPTSGAPTAQGGEAAESGAAETSAADSADTGTADSADAEASESADRVNPAIWVVAGVAAALIAGAFFLLRRGGD